MMQAAQQSIEAKFQREVAGETGPELIEQAACKSDDDEVVLVRRYNSMIQSDMEVVMAFSSNAQIFVLYGVQEAAAGRENGP